MKIETELLDLWADLALIQTEDIKEMKWIFRNIAKQIEEDLSIELKLLERLHSRVEDRRLLKGQEELLMEKEGLRMIIDGQLEMEEDLRIHQVGRTCQEDLKIIEGRIKRAVYEPNNTELNLNKKIYELDINYASNIIVFF